MSSTSYFGEIFYTRSPELTEEKRDVWRQRGKREVGTDVPERFMLQIWIWDVVAHVWHLNPLLALIGLGPCVLSRTSSRLCFRFEQTCTSMTTFTCTIIFYCFSNYDHILNLIRVVETAYSLWIFWIMSLLWMQHFPMTVCVCVDIIHVLGAFFGHVYSTLGICV